MSSQKCWIYLKGSSRSGCFNIQSLLSLKNCLQIIIFLFCTMNILNWNHNIVYFLYIMLTLLRAKKKKQKKKPKVQLTHCLPEQQFLYLFIQFVVKIWTSTWHCAFFLFSCSCWYFCTMPAMHDELVLLTLRHDVNKTTRVLGSPALKSSIHQIKNRTLKKRIGSFNLFNFWQISIAIYSLNKFQINIFILNVII